MVGSISSKRLDQLAQYSTSPYNIAYCDAELAVSSIVMVVIIIANSHYTTQRDGQAELTWVVR